MKNRSAITIKIDHQLLFDSAKQGHLDLLKEMITLGAPLEFKGFNGNTPLVAASFNGHIEVVRLLLEKGANIEATNNSGDTALTLSSYKGHTDIAKLLLENGANKEAKENNGVTAFILASYKGHVETVRLLLEEGANKEVRNKNGDTALTLASYEGHTEVVKLLLEKGAQLEVKGKNGNTSTIQAAFKGQAEIVALLLEKGANKEATNNDGDTALTLAQTQGHSAVVTVLQNFMKNTFQNRLEKYEGSIPNDLLCPISKGIMNDPITVSSGITYDRESLKAYFISKRNPQTILCPISRRPIKLEELEFETSLTIKNAIERFIKSTEEKANKKIRHKKISAHPGITCSAQEAKEEVKEKGYLEEQTREKRLLYFNNKDRLFQQQQLANVSPESANGVKSPHYPSSVKLK